MVKIVTLMKEIVCTECEGTGKNQSELICWRCGGNRNIGVEVPVETISGKDSMEIYYGGDLK